MQQPARPRPASAGMLPRGGSQEEGVFDIRDDEFPPPWGFGALAPRPPPGTPLWAHRDKESLADEISTLKRALAAQSEQSGLLLGRSRVVEERLRKELKHAVAASGGRPASAQPASRPPRPAVASRDRIAELESANAAAAAEIARLRGDARVTGVQHILSQVTLYASEAAKLRAHVATAESHQQSLLADNGDMRAALLSLEADAHRLRARNVALGRAADDSLSGAAVLRTEAIRHASAAQSVAKQRADLKGQRGRVTTAASRADAAVARARQSLHARETECITAPTAESRSAAEAGRAAAVGDLSRAKAAASAAGAELESMNAAWAAFESMDGLADYLLSAARRAADAADAADAAEARASAAAAECGDLERQCASRATDMSRLMNRASALEAQLDPVGHGGGAGIAVTVYPRPSASSWGASSTGPPSPDRAPREDTAWGEGGEGGDIPPPPGDTAAPVEDDAAATEADDDGDDASDGPAPDQAPDVVEEVTPPTMPHGRV